jgi:hypothetical protein
LVIIGEVFGMHHQLGGSTEDDMNKMSVIGHISLKNFNLGCGSAKIRDKYHYCTDTSYVPYVLFVLNK